VVSVVPGTSAKNVKRDYPTNVRLTARETGLPGDTVFLCFQLRSLDPARLIDARTGKPALGGRVPPERMKDVEAALRLVLAL
jgi:mRNA interferase MazF